LVAIFGVAGVGSLAALVLVFRKGSSRRTRNREAELLDELARTIAVINHGYVGLEQFARIVVNEASSKNGSSDSDIKRLFSTLADLSGARKGPTNVDNLPEEQREAARTQHENDIRAEFLSACAPPNSPVNPAIMEQMKTYLSLLGFRPVGQPDVLVLEERQGNTEEWVLQEIAERFAYPGVRSF